MNPVPLLIVMGTILALLAVQRLLARTPTPRTENSHRETSPTIPTAAQTPAEQTKDAPPMRQRGRKLNDVISVTGLDERGLSSLKALISKKDLPAITTFLAFNRPGFVEIDDYFNQLNHADSRDVKPTLAHTTCKSLLEGLTSAEHKLLVGFNPKSTRLISRDLMSRFGGHEFSLYFGHYKARPQSVTLHVPPFDPDRKILEKLTESGVARKGRHIPLRERLTVLKMSQLRQMAKDLNLDKKFTRKNAAAETLAEVPGAAVLLSMQYVIDDLFMLVPIKEDAVLIEHEWQYLEALAKMISGINLNK